MFKITKIFENSSIAIYRIEGKISDENLNEWTAEIQSIRQLNNKQIILDFSRVWFLSQKSLEALMEGINEKLFLLNCGIEMGNRLVAAGLSPHVLD